MADSGGSGEVADQERQDRNEQDLEQGHLLLPRQRHGLHVIERTPQNNVKRGLKGRSIAAIDSGSPTVSTPHHHPVHWPRLVSRPAEASFLTASWQVLFYLLQARYRGSSTIAALDQNSFKLAQHVSHNWGKHVSCHSVPTLRRLWCSFPGL